MIKFFINLVSLFLFVSIFGQSIGTNDAESADIVIFEKLLINGKVEEKRLEHYSWGWQEMPRHNIKKAGTGYLYLLGGTGKNENSTIQNISMKMRFINLFEQEPYAHLGIMGKSEGTARYNIGRGIIIGHLNGIGPTYGKMCDTGVRLQPETWSQPTQNNGNKYHQLWGSEYCSQKTFKDNTDYDIYISLGINQYYYKVTESDTGEIITANSVYDGPGINSDYDLINNTLEGMTLGLVFADQYPKKSWQLIFKDIKVDWK